MPAASRRSSCSRSPVPTGRGTPATSSCSGCTAPPGSARRISSVPGQVEEAKRRDHRVLGRQHGLFRSATTSARACACGCPRGRPSARSWRISSSRNCSPGLSAGLFAAHRPGGAVRDQRAFPVLPRFAVRADLRARRRPTGRCLDPPAREGRRTRRRFRTEAARGRGRAGCPSPTIKPAEPAEENRRAASWEKQQERYLLKPMNCPHHVQMYKAQPAATATCRCGWPNSAPSIGTSSRAS
jgi:threonyl-tRNA synthetase